MAKRSDSKTSHTLYHYDPSLAAAVAFAVIFLVLTIGLSYRTARYKMWFFTPFLLGGLMEVVGYVARAINAHQTPNWSSGPFIAQTLCLLLPPAFFAASIYMSLGRQIRAMRHEELSLISTKWMTKIFVLGDILSFLTQGAGGGIESQQDPNSVKVGAWVVVGGLVIQLIWFGFFVVVAGVFHFRLNKAATSSQVLQATGWRRFISVLYLACALILIRSIYRTIEFAEGSNGYLMQYEAYFYIFDAALMTIVVGLYTLFPPKELGGRRPQGGGTELRSLDAEDQRLSKP